jgi:hypothetical protein
MLPLIAPAARRVGIPISQHWRLSMARVTGIGGVFFRSPDPKRLAAWYAEHLGVHLAFPTGAQFEWKDEVPAGTGATAWNVFPETTN